MKIDLKELGKRIKLIRKGQDLTQEMLAEKAGVSQHYIYEIEAGRKAMSIHSFASLTCALDVSADYLLFGDSGSDGSLYKELSLYKKIVSEFYKSRHNFFLRLLFTY